MSRPLSIIRWVVLIVLSGVFAVYGVMELMGKMTPMFLAWGYPGWFVYLIGGLEVLGAAGLYYEKTLRLVTFMLAVIVAGAALTHIGHHEGMVAPLPALGLLVTLFGLMYLNAKYFAGEKK